MVGSNDEHDDRERHLERMALANMAYDRIDTTLRKIVVLLQQLSPERTLSDAERQRIIDEVRLREELSLTAGNMQVNAPQELASLQYLVETRRAIGYSRPVRER